MRLATFSRTSPVSSQRRLDLLRLDDVRSLEIGPDAKVEVAGHGAMSSKARVRAAVSVMLASLSSRFQASQGEQSEHFVEVMLANKANTLL